MLDDEGHILEQGIFNDLNHAGGYVSNFSLGPPELDCKPLKPLIPEAFPSQLCSPEKQEESEKETYSSEGDITIYLYYIRSIGWFSTLVFVVAISAFAFGLSFPSTSIERLPWDRTFY